MREKTQNIGIFVFDEVEVLDFAGPFEVFSTASRIYRRYFSDTHPPFEVFTVGESCCMVRTRGGLIVKPQFGFFEHPQIDILLIPGGVISAELEKPKVISWITVQSHNAKLIASVCTGAFLIGKAGLLAGKSATTHWEDIDDLRANLPHTKIIDHTRWVDEGKVITSAGISAGLDMSLHIVSRFIGKELATKTARQMDYKWQDDSPQSAQTFEAI